MVIGTLWRIYIYGKADFYYLSEYSLTLKGLNKLKDNNLYLGMVIFNEKDPRILIKL